MQTLELLKNAHLQTSSAINLIASENWFSPEYKVAYLSDIFHRYSFEPKDGALSKSLPQFYGRELLSELELKCNEYLKRIMSVKFSSVKPISGLNMMLSTISCLTMKKDLILSIPPEYGGHSATKYIAERIGLTHEYLPFKKGTFIIDCELLKEYVQKHTIKMIYIDMMNVTFPLNIKDLRMCVGKNTIICYDASHVLGLIMGKQFQNPFEEGVDIVIGSTHKTFPGPHKGIFLTNKKWFFMLYNLMYDMYISHHHIADVATLAMMLEQIEPSVCTYACDVVSNAQLLANSLINEGINVFTYNYETTKSHQIWISISSENLSIVASSLAEFGIIVNTIQIPSTDQQGLRIGVQEITMKQINKEDVIKLGKIIAEIIKTNTLSNNKSEELNNIKNKLYLAEIKGVQNLFDSINYIYNIN